VRKVIVDEEGITLALVSGSYKKDTHLSFQPSESKTEGSKFEASLGYVVTPVSKNKNKNNNSDRKKKRERETLLKIPEFHY
jgi:hypothetical protein